ncbi:MAG TPA: VapE domain-containing protein [Vampirovibrionales bacterium]
MINIFDSTFDKSTGKKIAVDEFLEGVKSGRWEIYSKQIKSALTAEQKQKTKRKTPAVTISGCFSDRRSIQSLEEHSGFICIDIDNVSEIEEVFDTLKKSEYTYSLFRSISGKGLAWIVKIDPNQHQRAFEGLSAYVFNLAGYPIDQSCKDVSRLRFVSFDPQLFKNEKSKVFKQYLKKESKKEYAERVNTAYYHTEERFEKLVYSIKSDITGDYQRWLKIGFAIASKYGDQGLDYFLYVSSFSASFNRNKAIRQYNYCCSGKNSGIGIGTFYYYAKQSGYEVFNNLEKEVIKQAVKSKRAGINKEAAQRILKDHKNIKLEEEEKKLLEQVYEEPAHFESYEAARDKSAELDINELEAFIEANWSIKRNVITYFYELDGERMDPEDWNSIYITCKKAFPKASKELVLSLLKSNFTRKYNPITDYLNSLKWDGVDRVSSLADSLNSCTGDLKFQQKMLGHWLLGMMQNLYSEEACPLVLVLTGKQRTGKTHFFRNLLPKRLKGYFGGSQLDRGKDDELLMTQKMLILDDEFSGKSKADAKLMKRLSSTDYFDVRPPYGGENIRLKRVAMLCGTCNETEILNDATGNRRFIVLEVNDQMDWESYNRVDKEQLLAQLKSWWEAGIKADLNAESVEELEDNTLKRYSEASLEEELITKYCKPPTDSEIDEMTNSDVKVFIEKITNQRLNTRRLGLELKKLGYKQKIVRNNGAVRRVYLVGKKPLYDDDRRF